MLTLESVKNNPQIAEFIKQSQASMEALGYTEHGVRHASLVAKRSRKLAQEIGLDKRTQELSAIAGYCQDMGNFIGRTRHHYWGALLFHQIFSEFVVTNKNDWEKGDYALTPEEIAVISQCLANHDKDDMKLTNPVSAIVVIADKSDVHRSRVITKSKQEIDKDIHDRVNYAATKSNVKVNKKNIDLKLQINTSDVPIMEYFEIFIDRMVYCRKAAEYLGYNFRLFINDFKLL
ncbi:MAG TPA: phosphohydrolase [Patescibacteria group bacterium]|nr:phosphohydrolase [Patescibacteria group bacterium]